MEHNYDLVVIGSGPGGYVGAIRAAQLGLKTAVIEKDKTFGGTCLNVGCIPSKALLESSEHYQSVRHDFKNHGIETSSVALNLSQMIARKDKIVKDLTGGIEYLFKKNKITTYKGTGTILAGQQVGVKSSDGDVVTLSAKNIMIATGSIPVELPFLKFDGEKIVSSTEALCLPNVPSRMAVVGGGAIGLELGSVWMRLGSAVTVFESGPKICGSMDTHLSSELQKVLTKQGMKFVLGAKVLGATQDSTSLVLNYESSGAPQSLECDLVLVAAGRRPYTQNLGLENVGIQLDERGRIPVNHHLQTSVNNVFAIGDVIAGPMLAHKAEEEGVAVAELISGRSGHVNYETVPSVIYTWPEVASVGQSEEQLKTSNTPYKVGKFPFSANGRARALGHTDGFVKILAHAQTDRLLGIHILGPRASDLIAEAVIAMEFVGSSEDLARSFHAHPTLSEVIREAALNVDQRARQG